jgi:hypothetical protein
MWNELQDLSDEGRVNLTADIFLEPLFCLVQPHSAVDTTDLAEPPRVFSGYDQSVICVCVCVCAGLAS